MINSVQKKILLFLVVVTNVMLPMEQPFFNISQQGFCEALTNVTMPIEKQFLHSSVNQHAPNYIEIGVDVANLAYLIFIIYRLVDLKKKHRFFGTNCMVVCPYERSMEEVSGIWELFSAAYFCHGDLYMSSGVIGRLRFLSVLRMIFVANFVHQDALALLKKSWKEFHPELTIKEKVDMTAVSDVSDAEVDITAEPDGSDAKCLVCWENETGKEYVNPCKQKDHIFCKECLMLRFEKQKEKFSFVNKDSFFCDMCAKEVPFNDDKFEITLPASRVTLKSWAQHVGVRHVILYSLSMYTLCLLLHSYLF